MNQDGRRIYYITKYRISSERKMVLNEISHSGTLEQLNGQ